MVEVKIPYVVQRGRSWMYRRRPPSDVTDKLLDGKTNWLKTWRPGTPLAQVEHEARQLAARHDRDILVARGEIEAAEKAEAESQARAWLTRDPAELHAVIAYLLENDPDSSTLAFVNAAMHGGTVQKETFSLTEALERDQRLHSGDKDERPFYYAVQSFIRVIGDRDINRITRDDVREWLAQERRRGLAPATVLRRLDSLRAMVGRAYMDLELDRANPFVKHGIPGGKGSAADRVPFNREHLALIDRYLVTAPRLHPDTRNLIRLLRNTGMGVGEAAGLAVADVSLTGDIPFVWVHANAIRTLKTAVRDRRVPLIGVALEAATDAVERATGPGLFDCYGASGRGADNISIRINAALRRAGIPRSPRLTSYSFRHGLVEALRMAGVQDDLRRRLMGHAARDIHGRYGATGPQLVDARDAMEAALAHLGDIDSSVYSEAERLD